MTEHSPDDGNRIEVAACDLDAMILFSQKAVNPKVVFEEDSEHEMALAALKESRENAAEVLKLLGRYRMSPGGNV
jgi:hypothetical protein